MALKKKPTDPPDDDVIDDDDVEFTPAQLRVMNNTVSAAVSAQLNRKLKPISDQLGEVSSLRESIEGIAKSLQGGKPKEGEGGDGKGGTPSVKDDPEIIAMRKRVEGMERAAAEKETAARNRDRDSRLTTIATTAGVDKNRVRGVVALLRDAVTFDKNGDPKMKVIRDGFDEEVDLEAGAGEFFKSDEGKAYLAPQQAVRGGSGTRTTTAQVAARGAAGGSSNAGVQQRGAAKQEAKQTATAALADAVGELIGGGNISLG